MAHGFTQDSVKKLMSLLDSQQGMDEKTYVELSNAAKYLYDKTNNSGIITEQSPPVTPVDQVFIPQLDNLSNVIDRHIDTIPLDLELEEELLGPSAVGRDINRRRERSNSIDDLEIAIVQVADWFTDRSNNINLVTTARFSLLLIELLRRCTQKP